MRKPSSTSLMTATDKNNQTFLTLLLCYVGLVIFVIGWVHFLVHVYALFPHSLPPRIALVSQALMRLMMPKPCENFVFVSSCFVVPIIASLFITYVARKTVHLSSRYVAPVTGFLIIIMTVIALFALYGSYFMLGLSDNHEQGFALLSIVLALIIWRYDLSRSVTNHKLRLASWSLLFVLFMIISLAFRVFAPSINYDPSIDPAIYSISQAVVGRVPLVDFPTQYGNYSVFTGPVLYFLGLHSLFALTVLFLILLLLAYAAIFYVLHKELRYTSLFLLSGLALLLINTNAFVYIFEFPHYHDPYFQYAPIRFFWPCISILLFYAYAKVPSLGKSTLLSLLSGVAIIWNLDTGIPIAGAFLAFLLLRLLFCLTDQTRSWVQRKIEIVQVLLKIALHFFIIGFCIMIFFCALLLKSGGPIHYEWINKYQQIFYIMGFNMLPLPRTLNPWMLVVALYLFGIIFSQFYWHKGGVQRSFLDLILYVSILGVGVFVYYSGRAHPSVLIGVLWPAIIVSALLVDRLFYLVSQGLIGKTLLVMTIPFWVIVMFASENLLTSIPKLLQGGEMFFSPAVNNLAASEVNFIQYNKGNNNACAILSQRQAAYYLETKLASPLQGPGLGEIILKSDLDDLMKQLLHHPVPCVFYGVGLNSAPVVNISLSELLLRYRIQAKNSEGSMLLLVPKK